MSKEIIEVPCKEVKYKLYDLDDCPLSEAINVLTEAQTELSKKYTDLRLEIEADGEYDDWYVEIRIWGKRLETDEEYSRRITHEQKQEKINAEYRKKQYEELKKEFGG